MSDIMTRMSTERENRHQARLRHWIRSWEALGEALYFMFGILTFLLGVVFIRSPEETQKYGFGFLGPDISYIGPALIVLACVQAVCIRSGFWTRLILVAAPSILFYGGVAELNASPTGRVIYGWVACGHMLLFPPRRS